MHKQYAYNYVLLRVHCSSDTRRIVNFLLKVFLKEPINF